MNVIREVSSVQLNEGQLMAKGLNNLYNTETSQVSLWFDNDVKESMMKLPDDIFLLVAKLYFKQAELQP
jgi:hypothetical protein